MQIVPRKRKAGYPPKQSVPPITKPVTYRPKDMLIEHTNNFIEESSLRKKVDRGTADLREMESNLL